MHFVCYTANISSHSDDENRTLKTGGSFFKPGTVGMLSNSKLKKPGIIEIIAASEIGGALARHADGPGMLFSVETSYVTDVLFLIFQIESGQSRVGHGRFGRGAMRTVSTETRSNIHLTPTTNWFKKFQRARAGRPSAGVKRRDINAGANDGRSTC